MTTITSKAGTQYFICSKYIEIHCSDGDVNFQSIENIKGVQLVKYYDMGKHTADESKKWLHINCYVAGNSNHRELIETDVARLVYNELTRIIDKKLTFKNEDLNLKVDELTAELELQKAMIKSLTERQVESPTGNLLDM